MSSDSQQFPQVQDEWWPFQQMALGKLKADHSLPVPKSTQNGPDFTLISETIELIKENIGGQMPEYMDTGSSFLKRI